ncbi:serine/threonine-protein kinase PDIK1L-like [Cavia porcellus]|uniref:non-specific serine/threonine protein kinase n=1 Tax=Cavia porcellus TaxID=10141 RepID=H0W276_CAVPO
METEELSYDLARVLGQGNYGVVYEAIVRNTSTKVAIKKMICKTPEHSELALRELWSLNCIRGQHPNVVFLEECIVQKDGILQKITRDYSAPLYLGLVESSLKGAIAFYPRSYYCVWFVMEFCEGGDMNKYLLSREPNRKTNKSFMLQMSSAVAFLHRNKIIHRDLKPENILVSPSKLDKSEFEPTIKVADFGLSKLCVPTPQNPHEPVNLNQCFISTPCGTQFYMAPEVWEGRYSAKTDIFSLGVIIWAMQERLTFFNHETKKEHLGSYIKNGNHVVPIGKALRENPNLELEIPSKNKHMNVRIKKLIKQMLAVNPQHRPDAAEVEFRLMKMSYRDSR